jgi:hypothetical protein
MKYLSIFVICVLSVLLFAGCCSVREGRPSRTEEQMIRKFSDHLLTVIRNKDERDYALIIPNASDWLFDRRTKTFYPQQRHFDPEIAQALHGKFRSAVGQIELRCGGVSKADLVESWYVLKNESWIKDAGLFQFDLYFKFRTQDGTITVKQDDCIQFRRGILVTDTLRILE